MRIPVVLAEHNVPEAIPYGRGESAHAAGYTAALPYALAGEALGQVGDTLARLERAKYEQGVKIEAAALQSHMELAAETALQSRKLTETDPDAYRIGANQDIQNAYTSALAQAKYPESKALLAQHLQHVLSTKGVEAMKWSNELYKSRNLGLLDTGLDDVKTLGARAPDQPAIIGGEEPGTAITIRGRADFFNEGKAAIISATPLLGEKATRDKLIAWRQDFGDAMARADLRTNPMADVSHYADILGPKKYDLLLAHQDALRREARVAREHEDAQVQKAVDHENDNRKGEIMSIALGDPASGRAPDRAQAARMLDFYGPRGLNVFKAADYEHLHKMITEPKDFASDPATREQMIINVYKQVPTWTPQDVIRANAAGKLNDADMKAALERLTTAQNQQQTQGRELVNRQQSEVERIGQALLTTTGPLEKLDPKSQALKARYGLEMLTNSQAYGGNETPHQVMQRVLPGLARQLKDDTDSDIQFTMGELRKTPYKALSELIAAHDAGKVPRKQFEAQRDLWLRLDAAKKQSMTIQQQLEQLFTVPRQPRGQ